MRVLSPAAPVPAWVGHVMECDCGVRFQLEARDKYRVQFGTCDGREVIAVFWCPSCHRPVYDWAREGEAGAGTGSMKMKKSKKGAGGVAR